jgi:hypothetical protein
MEERRISNRSRICRGGKILFNNRRSVLDCTIRNLSPGGACVQVENLVGVPATFDLPDRRRRRAAALSARVAVTSSRRRRVRTPPARNVAERSASRATGHNPGRQRLALAEAQWRWSQHHHRPLTLLVSGFDRLKPSTSSTGMRPATSQPTAPVATRAAGSRRPAGPARPRSCGRAASPRRGSCRRARPDPVRCRRRGIRQRRARP